MMPADIRQRMHEHIEWVFTQKKLSKQLLPSYKKFYGPAGDFDNVSMEELHAADMAFYFLKQEEHIDHLDELIAVLYRPAKKNYDTKVNSDGDVRIPFNSNETASYKKKIRQWPLNIKRAILMWYDGCRQELEELYAPAFEGGASSIRDYDGLYVVIRGIAEKKTYGDFNQVSKMNVHLAFKEMVETKFEEEELKNKYPELYKS